MNNCVTLTTARNASIVRTLALILQAKDNSDICYECRTWISNRGFWNGVNGTAVLRHPASPQLVLDEDLRRQNAEQHLQKWLTAGWVGVKPWLCTPPDVHLAGTLDVYTCPAYCIYIYCITVCVQVDLWFISVYINHYMSQFLSVRRQVVIRREANIHAAHYYHMKEASYWTCSHLHFNCPVIWQAYQATNVCVCLCVAQVHTRVGLRYRRVCGLKVFFITSIFGPGFSWSEARPFRHVMLLSSLIPNPIHQWTISCLCKPKHSSDECPTTPYNTLEHLRTRHSSHPPETTWINTFMTHPVGLFSVGEEKDFSHQWITCWRGLF